MISDFDTSATLSLVEEIVCNSSNLRDPEDDVARLNVIAAASKLIARLSTPMEHITQLAWGEPSRNASLKTVFDLGLLQKLGMDPLSSEQLAEGTVAEPELISRMMKNLAAYGLVNEAGQDQYTGTPFSMAVNDPTYEAALIWTFEGLLPVFNKLPEFLADTKYQVPTNGADSAIQRGWNTDKPFFAYLKENARLGGAFNKFITAWTTSRPRATDLYPYGEKLINDTSTNAHCKPMLVDVGGGLGHDLVSFHDHHPTHTLDLVLQETPHVIEQCQTANLPSNITLVPHDFFTPQPESTRGAKAYHLRQVLHNWPDEKCLVILSHIRDAMVPRVSRLLISEKIMSDVGAGWQETSIDLLMMTVLVSKERTESQMRDMLGRVGLTVVNVYGRVGVEEKILEVMREDEGEVEV